MGSNQKLKNVFSSSAGPLMVGLSFGLILTYLLVGIVMVKSLKGMSDGVRRCGNVLSISVAFGNATALPVLMVSTLLPLFNPDDHVFVSLCVMVYGTINKALMYTAGSAICCGKAKL